MPKKHEPKHLKGVGDKEQRQYEHVKESAEKSGRYGTAGLRQTADLIRRLVCAAPEVYVYFNNTHTADADAAVDALELKQLLIA